MGHPFLYMELAMSGKALHPAPVLLTAPTWLGIDLKLGRAPPLPDPWLPALAYKNVMATYGASGCSLLATLTAAWRRGSPGTP